MIKILFLFTLSVILYAECTDEQYNRTINIWKNAIHEKGTDKIALLQQANEVCPNVPLVSLDIKIQEAKKHGSMETFKRLKNLNNDLYIEPTQQQIDHKINNAKYIDYLWLEYLENEAEKMKYQENLDEASLETYKKWIKHLKDKPLVYGVKAVANVGGLYKADLLFDKNKYIIKDKKLAYQIGLVMHNVIVKHSDALFGLEGGASSEGNAEYNLELSKNRADSLKKFILRVYPKYSTNIKVFVQGESQLVCEGGLLPEMNTSGEYECLTKEDREKSRRVSIRRVK